MTDQNAPGADDQQEPEVVPNRRERRGHGKKNAGVQKAHGVPHQSNFVGKRVFRRTGG